MLKDDIDRLCKIKNYELMIPVNIYGPGKAFGELALIKDNLAPNRVLPRAASIVCLTDCKFAVMTKADYQNVLSHIDRKKTDKVKEFLGEIPLLKYLPKAAFKSLHLSMVKKACYRGQIIAQEGQESEEIFIIARGTFEVSKIIIANSKPKQRNTGHQ